MRYIVLIAGLVALSGCVDPLPVGSEGRFGPVLGSAPPEAVGPGPFLTGGGSPAQRSPAAAPVTTGTTPATFPAEWARRPGFDRRGSTATYVGGQEGVIIRVASRDQALRAFQDFYAYSQPSENCDIVYDIYGRQYVGCP